MKLSYSAKEIKINVDFFPNTFFSFLSIMYYIFTSSNVEETGKIKL